MEQEVIPYPGCILVKFLSEDSAEARVRAAHPGENRTLINQTVWLREWTDLDHTWGWALAKVSDILGARPSR